MNMEVRVSINKSQSKNDDAYQSQHRGGWQVQERPVVRKRVEW